jgi:hypothetical protein
MQKLFLSACLTGVMAAMSGNAIAEEYRDVQAFDDAGWPGIYLAYPSTFTVEFDFIGPIPMSSIAIGDPYSTPYPEYVWDELGFDPVTQKALAGEMNFYVRYPDYNPDPLDPLYNPTAWAIIKVPATTAILDDVNADGKITYTVPVPAGGEILDFATMSISTPDGGTTFALLGTAIVGLFTLRRKSS